MFGIEVAPWVVAFIGCVLGIFGTFCYIRLMYPDSWALVGETDKTREIRKMREKKVRADANRGVVYWDMILDGVIEVDAEDWRRYYDKAEEEGRLNPQMTWAEVFDWKPAAHVSSKSTEKAA